MQASLQLLGHILRMSSRRDRTEINSELVDAVADMFNPLALTVHRCYADDDTAVVFDCAGIVDNEKYCRNAYLPDQRFCTPIERDPLLLRCRRDLGLVLDNCAAGVQRLVFPIAQNKNLLYLIDITLPEDSPVEERVALMGLTEFFGKHIALLDYGETDTLTGLANRKTFDKHLFEVLGKAMADAEESAAGLPRRRHGDDDAPHWLAVCDIDHFKAVNDTHGHLIGDEVLVVLAQLMHKSFRLADQLFRFGGEEFVVVLQPTRLDHVVNVFERFRRNVEAHPFSRVGHATISIGVTRLLATDTPPDAIDRADEALYYVKQHGRNQAAVYENLVESGRLAAKEVDRGDIELF
ncbi:MAG: GGDEF domain-containing protein [Rhodocyclales bacterium]|nr:GGDEF domain-containing protein [Rhodocyclales bacterium]